MECPNDFPRHACATDAKVVPHLSTPSLVGYIHTTVRGQYIHSARNVCIGDTHSHRQSRAVVVRLTEWTILPCRYSACLQFSSRAQLQASSCAPLLLSCRSTLARWRRERSFPDISPLVRGLGVSRFVAAVLRSVAIIAFDTCSFSREYT